MSVESLAVLLLAAALAFANGANDVSKGVATLAGSGVTDYRRAIAWGALWTAVGGLLASAWAGAMLETFGRGVLAAGVTPGFAGGMAALTGAAAWVVLATRLGWPVSTTHAIVGSMVGVALLAHGSSAVRWEALAPKVVLPLLLTPLLSLVLSVLLLAVFRQAQGPLPEGAECLCADEEPGRPPAADGGMQRVAALAADGEGLELACGSVEECARERPRAARITVDHLHWISSGATSLARGMNDAPKIVALGGAAAALGAGAVSWGALYFLVTAGMVAGSLIAGRRVTEVLAEKVVAMDHTEGFAANTAASLLVAMGAIHGLPMSTTHVASGGIVGVGFGRGTVRWHVLAGIVSAWVVTMPGAAVLGCLSLRIWQALH